MCNVLSNHFSPFVLRSTSTSTFYFEKGNHLYNLHKLNTITGAEFRTSHHQKSKPKGKDSYQIYNIYTLPIKSTKSPIPPAPHKFCLHQKKNKLRQFILIFWMELLGFSNVLSLSFDILYQIHVGWSSNNLPLHFSFPHSSSDSKDS